MSLPKAIVVVTLDCVRPDHLGCYGYRGVDTPHVDHMAAEGVLFEQAIAQAPNTWVSHASIFTGCDPYKHGVRSSYTQLSDRVVTVAECLSEHGFATAGYPAHTLVGPALGFDRGFEVYDLDPDEMLCASDVPGNRYYRDWGVLWDRAQKWMSAQSSPMFVWLHYMGTHAGPLESLSLPPEYRRMYSPLGQFFDGKISWADIACVGQLVDFLAKSNLDHDSVVVVLSDHGEELEKNDLYGGGGAHNDNLLDSVMRIAIIIRAPGRLEPGACVSAQVRSVDIMPTILDLAGIPIPEGIDGVSLVPLCCRSDAADTAASTYYAYMENLPKGYLGLRTSEWKLVLHECSSGPERPAGTLQSLRAGMRAFAETLRDYRSEIHPWVYGRLRVLYRLGRGIYRALRALRQRRSSGSDALLWPRDSVPFERRVLNQGRVFGLFNLADDPEEHHNLAAEKPEVVHQLKEKLRELVAGGSTTLDYVEHDEKVQIERRLRALGYLE